MDSQLSQQHFWLYATIICLETDYYITVTLHEHHGVSNQCQSDCLFNNFFRLTSREVQGEFLVLHIRLRFDFCFRPPFCMASRPFPEAKIEPEPVMEHQKTIPMSRISGQKCGRSPLAQLDQFHDLVTDRQLSGVSTLEPGDRSAIL